MSGLLKIAVLLGGPSAEREVSLRSGAGAAQALRSFGHAVTELDPKDGTFTLPKETDVVFLALHGTYGEDGTVQEQLDRLGVPYTGCDAAASRIAFDKVLTKQRCLEVKIPTAKYLVVDSEKTPWPMGWQPPLVVKPVRQGSSVGLQFVERVSDWSTALREAFRYDSQLLVEEKIEGRETTVGILEDEALPVIEVRPGTGGYDYRNKYTPGNTEYFCPAEFDAATTKRIQSAALGAFRAVGGRDYSRVDVMVRADGGPVVLEVNTLPGMTETSLLPKAAAAAGISYAQLCQRMVDLALGRNAKLKIKKSCHALHEAEVRSRCLNVSDKSSSSPGETPGVCQLQQCGRKGQRESASNSGAEDTAVQTLRAASRRSAVATASGRRWIHHRFSDYVCHFLLQRMHGMRD